MSVIQIIVLKCSQCVSITTIIPLLLKVVWQTCNSSSECIDTNFVIKKNTKKTIANCSSRDVSN